MISKPVLAVLALTLLASGCATITRGSSEEVAFLSTPPGATVSTSIGLECVTPCTMDISRRDTFQATFQLEGETKTVFVDTEVAGGGVAGVAGNVLFGGVIGAGVDVATGAGLNHVPNPVEVVFEPEDFDPVQPPAANSDDPPAPASPYAPVADSPPLYEGTDYALFTDEQVAAYCDQDWETRKDPNGRTEFNPCSRRDAFN
ncbi:MAG: translation initiation factor 2 [Pseudomonadota bacterium]